MISARQPTVEERRALQRMIRQAVGRVSQRAQLILLSAQRHTVPELAALFAMSRATVRFWIRRFDRHGPAGLSDDPRRGRPRQVSPHVLATLVTMRQDDPRHAGYLATCWTVAMLSLARRHSLGVQLSISALRGTLPALGVRWRRPRLTLPPKVAPEQTRKQWRIAKAVVEAGPEATIFDAGEARLQLLPLLRALWQWAGQQVRVPTPGTNVTRARFGALNLRTGRWGVSRPRAEADGRVPGLPGASRGGLSDRPHPAHRGSCQPPHRSRGHGLVAGPPTRAVVLLAQLWRASQSRRADLAPAQKHRGGQSALWLDATAIGDGRRLLHGHDIRASVNMGRGLKSPRNLLTLT
jgi:transposase